MILFDIITIFPEQVENFIEHGIFRIAKSKEKTRIKVHNLRDWSEGVHKSVDDRPFGGGPGMILKVDVIDKAVSAIKNGYPEDIVFVIMFTPQGELLNQKLLRAITELSSDKPSDYSGQSNKSSNTVKTIQERIENEKSADRKNIRFLLLCGHYEGFDERVNNFVDIKLSVGEYVLSGGELPALLFIDGLVRLIPGVLGNERSAELETYEGDYTDYPQYTRPADYKGMKVPDILLNGDHKRIEEWRKSKMKPI